MPILETNVWHDTIFSEGWQRSSAVLDVVEPATGEVLAGVGGASPEDVAAAARHAASAQPRWAALPPSERAAVLRRAAALWEENLDEIATWIVRESGSVRTKAELELRVAAAECHEAAGLPTAPHGEVLTSNEPRWSFARRRPAGVVAVIAPFNFPLVLSIRSVAPALALGNAVLLKPDPRTAVGGGVALARVFELAGLPAGLLHVLPGGVDVGAAVVAAPEVSVVSFTGSTGAGRAVGELGGRLLKRTHLELGGNNALVVLGSADVEPAAAAGAFGSFLHQGQICMTTGRHLVHESLYDDYVAALAAKADALPVGDPYRSDVALGPLIDEGQRARVDRIVTESVSGGAHLAAGGTSERLFYRPTVIADRRGETSAFGSEIFGPVAPVTPFRTLDDVVSSCRADEHGLALGLLGDVGEAMELADRIPSGIVHINEQTVSDEPQAPFGGVGASGTGSRFGGAAANIEAFTETQWLTVRGQIAPYPF
ncbi:aldehyde dehydrogenase family protein [Nocardioides sp. LMS-CY]|uniref:aldehyde dehydrogenase family protein n=1 Tax=Nocardioides sp. (strain LMS-CY) TaxID=2840457 RepID=UPI001C004393|nr:aldehyde dehydrogenase family protein [Nocardioides sp. LMS-CY]QWF19986.1 aldehyde dehydrogenase family protein [Nocardioides sp. LMS-CY]